MIAEYYDLNMNPIDTENLITTNLHIPSVPFQNNWIGGQDGIPPIYVGATEQQRVLDATIELVGESYSDYTHVKNKLYDIFGFNTPFYVVDTKDYGKRYKVVLNNDYSPTRYGHTNGSVTVSFITIDTPYAESIGTTKELEQNGYNLKTWSDGMNLSRKEDYTYTHNQKSFQIYNAGNVPIHPFKQDLKITITNINAPSFELRNVTNGSAFKINEEVASNQTIVIEGATVTSNGLQYLRSTNKGFIELSPYWNEFEMSTNATIQFEFRFYYK